MIRIRLLALMSRWSPASLNQYREANSCSRKVRYSKASAIRAAITMADKKSEQFDAYECHFCKGWHIGHTAQPIRITVKRGRDA